MADVENGRERRLCVLKFGSSVLRTEADYRAVALEIYRHVRDGEKVVAVVSALEGATDALLAQAERVGGAAPDRLVARLARIGELASAALMALALDRAGMSACALDPAEMGLVAEGPPLDADLVGLDAAAVHAQLAAHDVVVVPASPPPMPSTGPSPWGAAARTSPAYSSPPASAPSASASSRTSTASTRRIRAATRPPSVLRR